MFDLNAFTAMQEKTAQAIEAAAVAGRSPDRAIADRVRRFQEFFGREVRISPSAMSLDLLWGAWWTDLLRKQGYIITAPWGGGKPRPPFDSTDFPGFPPRAERPTRDLAVSIAGTLEVGQTPAGKVVCRTQVDLANRGDKAENAIVSFEVMVDPIRDVVIPAGSTIPLLFRWEGERGTTYTTTAAVRPFEGDANRDDNFAQANYMIG